MLTTVSRRNSPQCTPTAAAEDLVLVVAAQGVFEHILAEEILSLVDRDLILVEFRTLFKRLLINFPRTSLK